MKRTKDKFETEQQADRKGISGLTGFDGEDLSISRLTY